MKPLGVLSFTKRLEDEGISITRNTLEVLQVNVGKFCNQACLHCHVEAGPKRSEIMEQKIAERVIKLLKKSETIHTVDITGGAPELNANFRDLVTQARKLSQHVIDRCNLTVLFEPGQEETAEFLAANEVHIIASLPCYSKDNVDKQRGNGVFEKSIRALRLFNELGYGVPGSSVLLDLVYNPLGPSLPPDQAQLEAAYKKELRELFGIEFNRLYAMTNMPIKRFLHQLEREGKFEEYMQLLASSFNPDAALGVMCRNLISVSWDGQLYDCDFNQMLEIPAGGRRITLWDIESFDDLSSSEIVFGNHCYGCTAGSGSSCSGAVTS